MKTNSSKLQSISCLSQSSSQLSQKQAHPTAQRLEQIKAYSEIQGNINLVQKGTRVISSSSSSNLNASNSCAGELTQSSQNRQPSLTNGHPITHLIPHYHPSQQSSLSQNQQLSENSSIVNNGMILLQKPTPIKDENMRDSNFINQNQNPQQLHSITGNQTAAGEGNQFQPSNNQMQGPSNNDALMGDGDYIYLREQDNNNSNQNTTTNKRLNTNQRVCNLTSSTKSSSYNEVLEQNNYKLETSAATTHRLVSKRGKLNSGNSRNKPQAKEGILTRSYKQSQMYELHQKNGKPCMKIQDHKQKAGNQHQNQKTHTQLEISSHNNSSASLSPFKSQILDEIELDDVNLQDSEYMLKSNHNKRNNQGIVLKKIKANYVTPSYSSSYVTPQFKKYSQVQQMLRQMHNFPWEHYVLKKKGISPEAYFNPDLFWLSINSVYFSSQAINLAKSIKNAKYFVKKFKQELFVNGFDNLTEQQKIIKKSNFDANFDDYLNALKNILQQSEDQKIKNKQQSDQQQESDLNQKQNCPWDGGKEESNLDIHYQTINELDHEDSNNQIDNLLERLTHLYQENKQNNQKAFFDTITKMKKGLSKGKANQVLRMMSSRNQGAGATKIVDEENDTGCILQKQDYHDDDEIELKEHEQKLLNRLKNPHKEIYSYHQDDILTQMKRLSQQDNQNNLLVDSLAQKPCSTQFLELLQRKTRQASIGKTGRYGLLLKRQKKAKQHKKNSVRVNMPLMNGSDQQTNSCFQLSSKQYNQNSRSVPTQKTYHERSAPAFYQNQDLENSSQNKPQKTIMEDVVCQICNDGDYDDFNLIVFCAGCNITVHQQCYGIIEVPVDDWICERCKFQREYPQSATQNQNTNCPLCPKSNGPMKPTLLLKNSDTNKNFEQDAINLQRKVAKTRKKADEQRRSQNNKQVDYFKEFDIAKVKWMHLSCALFVPEIGFLDEMIKQPIIGFDNLDYKRFKLQCSICGTKDGACIQCPKGKCQIGFHVECARRANYHMEIEKTGKDITYTIYCQKHRPLIVKKNLQSMEKLQTTHVMQFCKVLYKANNQIIKFDCLPKQKRDKIIEKQRAEKARQEKSRLKKSRQTRYKYDLNSDEDEEEDDDSFDNEQRCKQFKKSQQEQSNIDDIDFDYDDDYELANRKGKKISKRMNSKSALQNDKFNKDDERKLLNRIRQYSKECAKLTISLRKIKVKKQTTSDKLKTPLAQNITTEAIDDSLNKRKSKRLQEKSQLADVVFDEDSGRFNSKQKKIQQEQVVDLCNLPDEQPQIDMDKENQSDRRVGDITKSNREAVEDEVDDDEKQKELAQETHANNEAAEEEVVADPQLDALFPPEQQSKVTAYEFTSTNALQQQEKRFQNEYYYKANQLLSKVDYLYVLSDNFPWELVAFNEYTPQDCFQKFNKLIPNDILYQKEIMKKRNVMTASGKYHQLFQRSHPYCKCQKIRPDYQGSWIECSGKNCPAFNWMHIDCIELNYLQDEDIMQLGNYYCDSCKKKEKKSSNFPKRSKDFVNKIFENARRRNQTEEKDVVIKPLNQNVFNISREQHYRKATETQLITDHKVLEVVQNDLDEKIIQTGSCSKDQELKDQADEVIMQNINENKSDIDQDDYDEGTQENKKQAVQPDSEQQFKDQEQDQSQDEFLQEQEKYQEGNNEQEEENQQQAPQQLQYEEQSNELTLQQLHQKLMTKDGIDCQDNTVNSSEQYSRFFIKIKFGQNTDQNDKNHS